MGKALDPCLRVSGELRGFTGAPADWLASLVGPRDPECQRGPTGTQDKPGPQGARGERGTPGVDGPVPSGNGHAAAEVTVTAADFGAIPTAAAGAPGGVAQLDDTGCVPAAQLPSVTGAVASINNMTGAVQLTASDVGALATSTLGEFVMSQRCTEVRDFREEATARLTALYQPTAAPTPH
ncbi:hypothetical protein O1L44_31915 [Streptomyces noursei]|uniref:hypothetical protein n=1 Tax=Streptomyces noursei TaxID=1971 RepID=UPI0008359B3C|nr:hypothetical protein [Streptomyces noursei]